MTITQSVLYVEAKAMSQPCTLDLLLGPWGPKPPQVSMAGRKKAVFKQLLFPQAVLRFVEKTLMQNLA